MSNSIAAIYDFELFPYALGDVLTWNVRTAMRCEELGRELVDIYICVDERYPAGIYQRGLVNSDNFELFFSELYGAFGTHPRLGNIHIFRRREALLEKLDELVAEDPVNAEAVGDYLSVLDHRVSESLLNKARRALSSAVRGNRYVRAAFNRCLPTSVKTVVRETCLPKEEMLNNYFIKYIHSHESINAFAARHGGIPLLRPALGCEPDVDEVMVRRFAGKRIVPFHLRLRRLDAGYGGEHSYARDSDFLEWYDFLKEAGEKYPEVAFVALGRLQEKPLELLNLPNVTSLRSYGMGLGHELTLMLKGDLFIGTSSGFAALANFSALPHFITKMNPGSCHAYAIPEGAERLPFAREDQILIYEQETSALLMSLLEKGLGLNAQAQPPETPEEAMSSAPVDIDIQSWLNERSQPTNPAATTSRFTADDAYRENETAYLLFPALERARQALLNHAREDADAILQQLEKNFPELCAKFPQHRLLKEILSSEAHDEASVKASLETLDTRESGFIGSACSSSATDEAGWRPENWIVAGGAISILPEERQPAFMLQAASANAYWHTEQFAADQAGGRIVIHFDAKNSDTPSRHRLWIFEDGKYRSIGEFVAVGDWQRFRIPVTVRNDCILEFQVDQTDDSQWMSIRNFRIVGAKPLPLTERDEVAIPMASWGGAPCADTAGGDCRQWHVGGGPGFIKSPVLPKPGNAGLRVRFEARVDGTSSSLAAAYLFEGERYRKIMQFAFSRGWREFSLLLQPTDAAELRVQIDYPAEVETFAIRNFRAIPVDW